MFIHLSLSWLVCLYIHSSLCPFIHLHVCPICLYVHSSVCRFIYTSACSFLCLSVHALVFTFIHLFLFICLSLHSHVCPFIHLSRLCICLFVNSHVINSFVYICLSLSLRPSILISLCLSVYHSFSFLSFCLSGYPSVSLSLVVKFVSLCRLNIEGTRKLMIVKYFPIISLILTAHYLKICSIVLIKRLNRAL
jgi:hypothetical protein